MSSGSSSDGTFVGSWRAHQIVAEILSSPQAEQNQIIEVACGEDSVLRSRVMRMIASIESAAGDMSSEFSPSDSLHGTGDLVLRRKLECSATREVWTGQRRDDVSSDLLIHIFSATNSFLETTVAAFETGRCRSIEQLVSHGATPGGRPFLAFNRVNGVPIQQYLTVFTTSASQRGGLFDRIRDTIVQANASGLHHEALTADSIMISEIDGKPYPTIVGMGIHRLAFPGRPPSHHADRLAIDRILRDLEAKFGAARSSKIACLLPSAASCLGPSAAGQPIALGPDSSITGSLISLMRAATSVMSRQTVLSLVLLLLAVLGCFHIDFTSMPTSTRSASGEGHPSGVVEPSNSGGSPKSSIESTHFDDGVGFDATDEKSLYSTNKNPTSRLTAPRRSTSGGSGVLGIR